MTFPNVDDRIRKMTPEEAYRAGVAHGAQLLHQSKETVNAVKILDYAHSIAKYRFRMSYNSSYFGEPAGWLKAQVAEIDRLLPPKIILAAKTENKHAA